MNNLTTFENDLVNLNYLHKEILPVNHHNYLIMLYCDYTITQRDILLRMFFMLNTSVLRIKRFDAINLIT